MKTARLFNLSALSRISYTLGAGFLIAALALSFFPQPQAAIAGSGAIWTTRSGCGSQEQDANHFDIGDHIYINGSGFDVTTTYSWSIKGKPGGASCDPGLQVAGGSYQTDSSGAFCFSAYTVHADDCGEYQVKFGTKGDNYQVDGVPTNTPVPPTATDTPEPTATDTPEPTATDTPEPTATATISVETPTQEPTDPPADPTNTPAPTNPPDPTATPVDQILIPVTGADLTGGPSSPISSAGALGLSVAFLGLGLILQGYKRMQTES